MKRCSRCNQFVGDHAYHFCPYSYPGEPGGDSFDEMLNAANQGDAEAQYYVGCYYHWLNNRDDTEWWLKAAEQNNPKAQYELGEYFYYDLVHKDEDRAREWWSKAVEGFRLAAQKGDADAQYLLGTCYFCGRGIEKDEKKAQECWGKALSLYRTKKEMDARGLITCSERSTINEMNTIVLEPKDGIISRDAYARTYPDYRGFSAIRIADGTKIIGEGAFSHCNLRSVIIPDSVEIIEKDAFSYCGNLCSVIFSDGLKIIGKNAFYGCGNLFKIKIPETVEKIGTFAFGGCENLWCVYIDNLLEIGNQAFDGCESLDGISCPYRLEDLKIGEGAFNNCPSFHWDVIINGKLLHQGDGRCFRKVELHDNVIIPDDVTTIGYAAFSRDTSLTSVCIPQGVKEIGCAAFSGCTRLAFVSFPEEGIEKIGSKAFSDCKELKSIVLPNGLTEISDGAFYDCSGLFSVTIPNSVKRIGQDAFCGCSKLITLVIPESVQKIDSFAFMGCINLKLVVEMKMKEDEQRNIISDYPGLIDLIRERVNIVGVIQSYAPVLKQNGETWEASCPFNHENDHHLNIDIIGQTFECPVCGKRGDMFDFIMEQERLDFDTAVELIAHRAGIIIVRRPPDHEDAG